MGRGEVGRAASGGMAGSGNGESAAAAQAARERIAPGSLDNEGVCSLGPVASRGFGVVGPRGVDLGGRGIVKKAAEACGNPGRSSALERRI